MTYLTNKLNNYETYTYNIRLYVCKPERVQDLDAAIDRGDAIILADNAQIARYNINSLEQVFRISHSLVREGVGSQFDMRIVEPNGVTLLSTIKGICNQLGIADHLRATYIIAVDFHGRLSDGQPKKFPQTFYYPVVVSQFTFKVDEGGSNYQIRLVENSQVGYQVAANEVRNTITIQAETVGEFVDQFEEKLNQSLRYSWRANASLSAGLGPDEYKFEFDGTTEDWRSWRFEVLDADFQVGAVSFEGVPGRSPKLQVVAMNGTQITTLMSQVLQLTAEYKQILINQGGEISNQTMRRKPEDASNRQLDVFPVFFKMISNVEYNEYDQFRGDYRKTYRYKLKAYTATDEILDANQFMSSIGNSSVQRSRIFNLIAGDFLRKRYDYYFTGRNTEVLSLDLQFDYAYFNITPMGDGYFGDPDVQRAVAAGDDISVRDRLSKIEILQDDLGSAKSGLARAQRQFDNALGSGSRTQIGFAIGSLENASIEVNARIGDIRSALADGYDFNPSSVQYLQRWVEDTISDSDTYGSENNLRSGALKFGAVKTNLENSGDLITIEMEVRGDPYWMGKPNTFYNQQQNIEDLVDYEAGAPSFFLNVNLPSTEEDADGRRKPDPDYMVSGVYRVVSVINRFHNGQFIQYLEAVRDIGTNVATVYDMLAGDTSVDLARDLASLRQQGNSISQRIENARLGLDRN